jgi:hypothetical protein
MPAGKIPDGASAIGAQSVEALATTSERLVLDHTLHGIAYSVRNVAWKARRGTPHFSA